MYTRSTSTCMYVDFCLEKGEWFHVISVDVAKISSQLRRREIRRNHRIESFRDGPSSLWIDGTYRHGKKDVLPPLSPLLERTSATIAWWYVVINTNRLVSKELSWSSWPTLALMVRLVSDPH